MNRHLIPAALLLAALPLAPAAALDAMEGHMYALPAQKIVIDGKLDDWNHAAKEWIAISSDIADRFAGEVMVAYDRDALYLAAEILTAGGPMVNVNKPGEKPWLGHEVEFRCITDPAAPRPLDIRANDADHPSVKPWAKRIFTLTMWEETVTHTPHISIVNGPPYNDKPAVEDPADVKIAFSGATAPDRYRLEARIPWSRLGVADGVNPFRPGAAMTAFWTVMWPQSITQRAECLRIAPTTNFGWAWHRVKDWGKIEFMPADARPPRRPTLPEYLARTADAKTVNPFTVEAPSDGLLSVNIVDADGQILREIAGALPVKKGAVKLDWDGFDWLGNPMKPGSYQYRAYIHQPLRAVFAGAAGTSARVPYETTDKTGNWGGNMAPPTDVAAAADGLYLLWGCNEGGQSIVKTDLNRNVLWRNTPYVINGGYGPHGSIAANRKYAYVVSGWFNTFLTRYDAANGLTAPFGDRRFLTLDDYGATPPPQLDYNAPMPAVNGISADDRQLFIPFHYRGKIDVLDAETGALLRSLPLADVRATALDEKGDLYAVTGRDGNGWHGDWRRIWVFSRAEGKPRLLYTFPRGICENPWGIAVRKGEIYITDNGHSNRLYRIASGKITATFGAEGGRPWGGKYDSASLLRPAGLDFDRQGRLWIAEAALPNLFKCIDPATMKVCDEWFGDVGYCPPSWPDCDDPLQVYVKEYFTNGVVRSRLKGDGSSAGSDAYWNFRRIGWPQALTEWTSNFRVPYVFRGPNRVKYTFASTMDVKPATLIRMDGDRMTPVNYLRNRAALDDPAGGLELWTDRNADGQITPDELEIRRTLAGRPLTVKGQRPWQMGPATIRPDGTLYLAGSDNAAYRIPLRQALPGGALEWDWGQAKCVAREIVPHAEKYLHHTARETLLGLDVDDSENLFFSFNANLRYASPAWGEKLKFGLGHTGRYNAVKITSFDRNGKRRFIAGRKASGVLKPGEMYHHWAQAGLIGGEYVAVASEWTPFTLYTHDGFFVQTLLADPNRGDTPSPYSLGGGETFAGRLQYFPERGECYLYTGNTHGMVYRLEGLTKSGRIAGEQRWAGSLTLNAHRDPFVSEARTGATALLPLTRGWAEQRMKLADNSGDPLATVAMRYDATHLYADFEVRNPRPFRNGADDPALIFKGGDAVGIYLGRGTPHREPEPTDIRILASLYRGKPEVIALLPRYEQKRPYEYFTTAGGRWKYDFAGILPGARAEYTPQPGGYRMRLSIPLAALPEELRPEAGKTLGFEAEVLTSGNGVRGLQALGRHHLYTPRSAGQAKMVDDIPSEARSYPAYWGKLEVGR